MNKKVWAKVLLTALCLSACSSVNYNVKQANSFVFQAGVEKYLQGKTEEADGKSKENKDR